MVKSEIVVFILYLICMLSIGVVFFIRDRKGGEKTFFLGDRRMGAWVGALSAGASDMSAWVLMGLPTSIYAFGLGQIWIPVGLVLGYAASWLIEAPRLRRFSIVSGDAITIPQYLSNRFLARSKALQVICAAVFLLAYMVYAASSIQACGTLFHKVIGMNQIGAMFLAEPPSARRLPQFVQFVAERHGVMPCHRIHRQAVSFHMRRIRFHHGFPLRLGHLCFPKIIIVFQ